MADIMLHNSTLNQVTCVANSFIDNYMKDANGEFVKIYLYLLRSLGREGSEFSISDMAEDLDHTERDIMRALTYWSEAGLLHLEYNSDNDLVGIWLLDEASKVVPMKKAPAAVVPVAREMHQFSPEQIAAFSEDEAVKELLYVAARFVGHPLSITETNLLLFWIDDLKMDTELIEHLIENCVENGHTSFQYMNTIAMSWADQGISSVAAAVDSTKSHSDVYFAVTKAFGIIGRALADVELSYIDKWTGIYNFSSELIKEACTRTVLSISKPDFKYADSILLRWHNNGVSSLEDIKPLDEAHKNASAKKVAEQIADSKITRTNRFTDMAQREYDFDALEQQLLKRTT